MTSRGRVGVLTFHRCINYGSFWQARCLVEGLRRGGRDAVLLDHHSRRVNRAEWACALSPLRPARTPRQDFRAYSAKARKFIREIADLPLSRPFPLDDPQAMEPCDAVVVGSDEVWNLHHPWYSGCPLFFGDGVKGGRVVAYAASFGSYDAAHGLGEAWASRLARFAAIAVRDENSRRLIRDGLGADPALVLDPCLLFEDLCRRPSPAEEGGDVLVYGHSFPAWFSEAVRRWADTRGVRLVSLGYRNAWADEQRLDVGPEAFAQAMGAAAAVVTNFFHGCVFSLVNRKPFACAPSDYRSNKVTALAETVGAQARLITQQAPPSALRRALDRPLEAAIGTRLAALRLASHAYLEQALA